MTLRVPSKVPVILALLFLAGCIHVPNTGGKECLYVTDVQHRSIQVFDAASLQWLRAIPWKDRVLSEADALRFEAAERPGPEDGSPMTGGGTGPDGGSRLMRWAPEALVVDAAGTLYGLSGDESPSFVIEINPTTGQQRYFDILWPHAVSIVASADRVCASYFNQGVWCIDPVAGHLKMVETAADAPLQMTRIEDGWEQADTEWLEELQQSSRTDGQVLPMGSGCRLMTADPAGNIWVSGSFHDEDPAIYRLDPQNFRLSGIVRFKTRGLERADREILGLWSGAEGRVYVAVGNPLTTLLELYTLDPRASRVRRAVAIPPPDGPDRTTGGIGDVIGNARYVFVARDRSISVYTTSGLEPVKELAFPAVVGRLGLSADGSRLYVTLPAEHRILALNALSSSIDQVREVLVEGSVDGMVVGAASSSP